MVVPGEPIAMRLPNAQSASAYAGTTRKIFNSESARRVQIVRPWWSDDDTSLPPNEIAQLLSRIFAFRCDPLKTGPPK